MMEGKFKLKNKVRTRDAAIRHRYKEKDKKQQPPPPGSRPRERVAGTVSAMDISEAIIMPQNTFIIDVARTMAGARVDAVLITDSEDYGVLCGIVTDKDLAFRCIAQGLEPATCKIKEIMTHNPTHVTPSAPADVCINMMLNGHFRHLPVVDNGTILGVVDITKVLLHIQGKINNSWGKAKALKGAFQEFQQSWTNFTVSNEVQAWFSDWDEKMVEPTLSNVMDYDAPLCRVGCKTSVRDAARTMKECKQTAVLVFDNDELAGIFTTKDIVLRVLAPGDIDPKSTSVVRMMTPSPSCGSESMTVKDALKKMHDGHYLHVPVLNAAGDHVVGMVDVLMLTYQTMEQLLRQQLAKPSVTTDVQVVDDSGIPVETHGPMWSRFWQDADGATSHGQARTGGLVGEDSVGLTAPSISGSQSATTATPAMVNGSGFVFKFRDPLTGKVHRFSSTIRPDYSPLSELLTNVLNKCQCEYVPEDISGNDTDDDLTSFSKSAVPIGQHFQRHRLLPAKPFNPPIISRANSVEFCESALYFRIAYKDDEGDMVELQSDSSVIEAVSMAKSVGWGRIILKVELSVSVESDVPGDKKSRMIPLIPLVGRDGSYALTTVENGAISTCGQRSVVEDTHSIATATPTPFALIPDVKIIRKQESSTHVGVYIGIAGALVGVMSFGMMVASRLRR